MLAMFMNGSQASNSTGAAFELSKVIESVFVVCCLDQGEARDAGEAVLQCCQERLPAKS